jgi:hypothetical protein
MNDDLGVLPHSVEAVLGHVDGHRRGVAGVYNKATYTADKRAALTKWADYVDHLVNGERPAQEVALPTRTQTPISNLHDIHDAKHYSETPTLA